MTTKRKIIIYLIIFLIATCSIIYFIILPTVNEIKRISNDIYLERVDLEKKYQRGQLLRVTIKNFETIKPKKSKLESVFINEGEELKFITSLEKIANDNNLNQEIKVQEKKIERQENNYYPLSLAISIRGEFINIMKYLQSLEKLNYYFNISAINIGADGQNKSILTNITGEIYVLPIEK